MTTDSAGAADFLALVRQRERGKLKVYIGSAAGTGKTYRMLNEAHDLRRRGVDVVVGYVETHGRADTDAQVGDLEIVPRKQIEYRGVTLEEMDVDGVIARRPQVAIVDELAHTNVPGARNGKRWQDVMLLLDEGINVISAVNVQHLESLNDVLERELGVTIRETVPDWVVGQADQVVNLDISAEDLRQRLREGKIYHTEKIQAALANFFTDENLTTLRELALREVANSVDRSREEIFRRAENGGVAAARKTVDRVMACLSSDPPLSRVLLRKASRIAGRLNTDWFCVYVQTPDERADRIDSTIQRHLVDNIQLAQSLGAEVVKLEGDDVALSLRRFAAERGVTMAIVGETRRSRWYRLRRGSIVDRLLAAGAGIDVLVVSVAGEPEFRAGARERHDDMGEPTANRVGRPTRVAESASGGTGRTDAVGNVGSVLSSSEAERAKTGALAGALAGAQHRDEATMLTGVVADSLCQLDEVRLPLHILLESRFGELNENQEELLRDARTAADAIDVALRQLGQIADADRGAVSAQTELVQINDVVRSVLPLARAAAERRGARLDTSLEPGLPRVVADRARLAEALALFAMDAAEASSAQTPLTISTARDGPAAIIRLSPAGQREIDHGPPIFAARLLSVQGGSVSVDAEGVSLRVG